MKKNAWSRDGIQAFGQYCTESWGEGGRYDRLGVAGRLWRGVEM